MTEHIVVPSYIGIGTAVHVNENGATQHGAIIFEDDDESYCIMLTKSALEGLRNAIHILEDAI